MPVVSLTLSSSTREVRRQHPEDNGMPPGLHFTPPSVRYVCAGIEPDKVTVTCSSVWTALEISTLARCARRKRVSACLPCPGRVRGNVWNFLQKQSANGDRTDRGRQRWSTWIYRSKKAKSGSYLLNAMARSSLCDISQKQLKHLIDEIAKFASLWWFRSRYWQFKMLGKNIIVRPMMMTFRNAWTQARRMGKAS